jgi:hypothetical protein
LQPLILLVFFKTSWHIVIQVIIGTNFLALAIGFIFLDLERHLKNWYIWYRSRTIETKDKFAKISPIKEITGDIILTHG